MVDSHINFSFQEPWIEDNNIAFVEELRREIVENHVLSGVSLKTIARRLDRDDILFKLFELPNKYVEVHLTWTKETSKDYPRYIFYNSFEEWIRNRMIPSDIEYET